MDFKIIDIKKGTESFVVTIEIMETMERRGYAFPIGSGWEEKINNGEFKWLSNIRDRLTELEEKKKNVKVKDYEEMEKLKGKTFKDKK